jgi:hypothetical protein
VDGTSAINALAGLRAAVGVGTWTTPRLAARLFGLDPDRNPQLPYLGRLFGVRDLALAMGTLSSEGEARRRWVQLGVACDVADAAAAVLARRSGHIGPFTTVLLTTPAVAAAGLGVVALQAPPPGTPG